MVKSPLRVLKSSAGKRSPVKKLRGQRSPNVLIKWSDKLIISLLTLILEIAPHRYKDNKKVGAKWEEVTTRFLNLPECSEIKETFINMEDGKEGASRRLKEKYWKVTKDVETILGVGTEGRPLNNSGLMSSPELTELKRLCEAIDKDKGEDCTEDKDTANKVVKCKNKLNDVEQDVWKISKNKRAPLKTKNVDGSIVDLTMSNKSSSKKGFDEQLLEYAMVGEKKRASMETEVHGKMMISIQQKKRNEISLFKDARCNLEDAEVQRDFRKLQNLGLDTLVTVYCNPGGKFSMRFFMKTLKKLKFSYPTVLKLYNALQQWKSESMQLNSDDLGNEIDEDSINLLDQSVTSPVTESEGGQEVFSTTVEQDLEEESIEIDDNSIQQSSDIRNDFYVEI